MAKTPPPRRAPAPRVADLIETSCLYCALRHGRAGELHAFSYRHELRIGSRRFRANLKGERCAVCGRGGRGGAELTYLARIAGQLADEGDRQPEAVRFIRERAWLTAVDLARLLGVSRQTVHRWECGTSPIDVASFAVLRLLFHEGQHEQGTPLREWLEQVNDLRRRRFRRSSPTITGEAPALDKLRRQATRSGERPAAKRKRPPARRAR